MTLITTISAVAEGPRDDALSVEMLSTAAQLFKNYSRKGLQPLNDLEGDSMPSEMALCDITS